MREAAFDIEICNTGLVPVRVSVPLKTKTTKTP